MKSILPKAIAIGIFGGVFAVASSVVQDHFGVTLIDPKSFDNEGRLYASFSFALGFLVVWRNGHAFSRWWEGIQTLAIAMTEWMDSCSQLVATTTNSKKSEDKIRAFNHVVTRLFSLLTCLALKHVADADKSDFNVLNLDGLDDESRRILWDLDCSKLAVIEQWILNTIHRGMADGIVVAPPPIVTRVFQELANGTFHVERLVVISNAVIPETYTVMVYALLNIHLLYSALIGSCVIDNKVYMFFVVFLSTFVLWGINLIAVEIEHPFGDDHNDIDVCHTQNEVNRHLRLLLSSPARHKPVCESVQIFEDTLEEDMPSVQVFSPEAAVEGGKGWSHRRDSVVSIGIERTASSRSIGDSDARHSISRVITSQTLNGTSDEQLLSLNGENAATSTGISNGTCPAEDSKHREESLPATPDRLQRVVDKGRQVAGKKACDSPLSLCVDIDILQPANFGSPSGDDAHWWREIALDVRNTATGILQQLVQQRLSIEVDASARQQQRELVAQVARLCTIILNEDKPMFSRTNPLNSESPRIHAGDTSLQPVNDQDALLFPAAKPATRGAI